MTPENQTERLPDNYQTKDCSAAIQFIHDVYACFGPSECKYNKYGSCLLRFDGIAINDKSDLEVKAVS